MAVWCVWLPVSLAKPRILRQSTCAAIEGVRSSATSTDASSTSRKRSGPAPAAARQVHPQAADHVRHVALPLAEVGVLDAVEDAGEAFECLLDGPLGVHVLPADQVARPGDEHRVVQHQELGVEQRRQLARRRLPPRGP